MAHLAPESKKKSSTLTQPEGWATRENKDKTKQEKGRRIRVGLFSL
jgi:hypothetical protein